MRTNCDARSIGWVFRGCLTVLEYHLSPGTLCGVGTPRDDDANCSMLLRTQDGLPGTCLGGTPRNGRSFDPPARHCDILQLAKGILQPFEPVWIWMQCRPLLGYPRRDFFLGGCFRMRPLAQSFVLIEPLQLTRSMAPHRDFASHEGRR